MKQIDKSTHEAQALTLIDDFMGARWIETEQIYANISYNNLRDKQNGKSVSYRDDLEDIISDNQEGYCCFCMRKIGEGDTKTLEHIIPDKFEGKENRDEEIKKYEQYVGCNMPYLTKENVELAYLFKEERRSETPPYPHDISYHNLVLSCDGKYPTGSKARSSMTCNNYRKQKDYCPVFYDKNMTDAIEYEPSGEIKVNVDSPNEVKEKIAGIVIAAGLSYSSLRAIRHLWYLLRHASMGDLVTIASSEEDVEISTFVGHTVTGDSEEDDNVRNVFNNIQIWKTFLEYSWFKDYYSQRYP